MRYTLLIILLILVASLPSSSFMSTSDEIEEWLVGFIDSDPYSAYRYASKISNISIDVESVGYSFRSVGSMGIVLVGEYIKSEIASLGVFVEESFDFINWSIFGEPNITLIIDNVSSTHRIYPTHLCYGTPSDGLRGEVVYLPLPENFSDEPLPQDIIATWNNVNLSGKIVLVGREVVMNSNWMNVFGDKVSAEKPKAVLYTWATNTFENFTMFFSSNGGRRFAFYRDNKVPVAWVDRNLAKKIIESLDNNKTVKATLRIPVEESNGVSKNLILTIHGEDKNKTLIVSAHYDSVMTPALSDNAAGVAGVIELAKAFSAAIKEIGYVPPINIRFIFFSGEEAGLIGSANYIEDHMDELSDIVGVVNLDTLGSYKLEITQDNVGMRVPSGKIIQLSDIVGEVASELGIEYRVVFDEIHSDDSAFTHPSQVEGLIRYWWPNYDIEIGSATPIAGIMISSSPYLPWTVDEEGRRGYIHTPYDNTTSTKVFDWVNPVRLENQIKVAGISILRILSYYEKKELQPIIISSTLIYLASIAVIVIIVVFYAFRRKPRF